MCIRDSGDLGGLLEQGVGGVVLAGVAVHLRDALQRPHRVPRLPAPPGLGEQLLVQPADGLVVALDASGLGQTRQRVAAYDDVPAALAQVGREPEQPAGQPERAALPGQRAAAPQRPGHRRDVPGPAGGTVTRLPGPVRLLDPAQSALRLGHREPGTRRLPGPPGTLGSLQLLGAGGQDVGQGGVDGQGGQRALVLRGECLAVHRCLSVRIHIISTQRVYMVCIDVYRRVETGPGHEGQGLTCCRSRRRRHGPGCL